MLSGAGVTYTYDCDGRRVKKLALSEAEGSSGTLYWYTLSGYLKSETDAGGAYSPQRVCDHGRDRRAHLHVGHGLAQSKAVRAGSAVHTTAAGSPTSVTITMLRAT